MDFITNLDPPAEEDNQEGQEEKELILGKFKTQDDLIKSYQELEREFTKATQERKEYEEANREWDNWYQTQYSQLQSQLQQAQARQQPQESQEDLSTRLLEKPREVVQEILKSELTPLIAPLYQGYIDQQIDLKIADMKSKYPDFVDLRDKIADEINRLVKNYPYLQYESNLIEDVYWVVKGKESQKAVSRQGGERAYGEIPNKRSGVKRDKSEEDLIGDEIVNLAKTQQGFFKF